ncbi:unnamed protein product, partial [Coregonus sp. 'balchen']
RTEEGLSEEECSHVYPLVFASRRGLASAAGAFLYHNHPYQYHLVISIYRVWLGVSGCVFHEHGAYLVDSLWGVAGSELRDWDTMTSLLVQEAGQGQGLVDEEEGALIELMMCAVRQAAEGHPPVGRAQAKKILSMKDKKIQAQDKRRITTHFITLLPQLLAKYLDLLLAQVCGIVEKHTESGVLEACARVACALCHDKYTFSGRADLVCAAFHVLWEKVRVANSTPTKPLAHPPSDSLRFDMAAFLLDYFYKDYGDIIKETLSKTKMISPVQSAKTVCLSLQQLFSALAPESVGGGQEFGEIRELAKRLAMSFGIDLHRIRKPLVSLHMDGIRFALREAGEEEQPPNLPFLEILSEFSFKLLRQDRAQLGGGEERHAVPPQHPRSQTQEDHPPGNLATPGLTSTVQRQPSNQLPVTHNTHASTTGSDKGSIISEPESDEDLSLPVTHNIHASTTGSDKGSIISEPESDEDFSEGSLQRKVEPRRRSKLPIAQASPSAHCDLESHLTMLSLIEEDDDEDDEVEEKEPEIEDFESDDSDHDTAFTLPSTRRSTSYLEELFQ